MFMGQYNHTIDPKGRLIVPAKFRTALEDMFVVTQGLDGCLYAYDNKEWAKMEEKLSGLPLINKSVRTLARHFLSGAAEVEVDKQGRVLIPLHLREYAKIDKDVVFVGVASRIEIWAKEMWDSNSENEDMEMIEAQMAELGLTI